MGAIDTLSPDQQLEAIYVGYYDRAADPGGFGFWEGQYATATAGGQTPDQALNNIANSFAPQSETLALYPFLGSGASVVGTTSPIILSELTSLIGSVYNNLFDRTPPAGDSGVAYWVGQLTSGAVQLGQLILDIANGATGADATTLLNKISSADFFTTTEGSAGLGFTAPLSGSFYNAAVAAVATVTSSPASVTAAEAAATAYAAGGGTGSTFTLTTGIDAPGTGAFATASIAGGNNLIYGTFNGTGATYTAGDAIVGQSGSIGNILNLSDLGTGGTGDLTPIATTVSNISNLVVSSGESVEINTITAFAGFSGLTQLTVTSASSDHHGGDAIAAAATTNVTVNDAGAGGVSVDGGNNIVITESGSGSVKVGDGSAATATAIAPVGTVTVTMTDSAGAGGVTVDGGTTIVITTSETGDVAVGNGVTGTVTVTDTATGAGIDVDGGVGTGGTAGTAAVFVQAAGDYVHVGEYESGAILAPTGDVVVNDIAATAYDGIVQATDYWVTDRGGVDVTIDTNAGGVEVGYDGVTPVAGADPTGDVMVTDTATGVALGPDAVQVYGGANVNISAVAGSIVVGDGSAASDATGNVTIAETGVDTGYHYDNSISVSGGVNVSIATTGAGGGISVGGSGGDAPVTGTVNITDSYSGQYHDNITVYGGTTVTITENATELTDKGYNTVGLGSGITAATTTAADLAADASGNVTITNESTFGADTVYGGGGFAIYTNGSQQVSVTGAYDQDNYITDAQSDITGGVSTLQTISLTGLVYNDVYVTANALTTLSLTNSYDNGIYLTNTVASSGLTLNLTNASDTGLYDGSGADGIGGTVTVNSTGSASGLLYLDLPNATGLVFNNSDASLYVDLESLAKVTTITVTGSGYTELSDVAVNGGLPNTTLTSVNASANTGGVSVTLNGDSASFTGGSGDNVVTVEDTTGLNHLINGGTGASNEIVLTNIAALYTGFLGGEIYNNTDIQNFQILGLTGAVDGQPGTSGTYDVAGFSSVIVSGDSGALSLIDAGAAETLTLAGTITSPVTWSDQAATGTLNLTVEDVSASLTTVGQTAVSIDNDSGSLTLAGGGATTAITVTGSSGASLTLTDSDASVVTLVDSSSGVLTVEGLNSLTTITVSGSGSFNASGTYAALTTITDSASGELTLDGSPAAALTTVTDSGSGDLNLVGDSLASLTTVNAAGSSGTVEVDGSASITGVAFTGGSGSLEATGSLASAAVVDSYTTGSGGGDIILGAGGAGTTVAGELVNLTASASVQDLIVAATAPAQTETVTVTWGAFSGAGTETIDGVTVTDTSGGVFTADQVATVAGGGTITGLTVTNPVTSGTMVAAASGATNVFTTTNAAVITTGALNGTDTGGGTAPTTGAYSTPVEDGARAIITGFQNYVSGNHGASDVIETGANPNAIAVVTSAESGSTGTTHATYTVSDGVFTLASPGVNPGFNELVDVQTLINADGADAAGMVQIGTTTYVIEAGAASTLTGGAGSAAALAGDTILQLNNVTGMTGFAFSSWDGVNTSSGQTIAIDNLGAAGVANLEPNSLAGGNMGATNGATYNDAGYSVDTLLTEMASTTTVDTYNNLGNFAALEIGYGGVLTQGNVVVNQVGTNSELIVMSTVSSTPGDTSGGFTLNSLTYSGDALLAADSGSITIDTLINASNSQTTLSIASNGANAVTIGAISDTALTTIDASHSLGAVTLGGDGLLTDPGAITTAGLTIDGGSGLLTAYASGAGDSIYGGDGGINVTASGAGDYFQTSDGTNTIVANGASDVFHVGNATLTANGAGDAFTVYSYVAGISASGAVDSIYLSDGTGFFNAGGNGDTITLSDGSYTLAGTGLVSTTITGGGATASLGAGDTINIDGSAGGSLWVGENTTINLDGNGSTHIYLSGDVTGGNSSSFIQTTITGAAGHESSLTLSFDLNPSLSTQVMTDHWAGGTSETSQVNVATATSLAGALDLAASQAAVEAHQFNSGTDTTVTSGATAALQINAHIGLVDWFQYSGNTYIVEANNTSLTAAAAHTALGANDVVVELTGIVNVNHIHLVHA